MKVRGKNTIRLAKLKNSTKSIKRGGLEPGFNLGSNFFFYQSSDLDSTWIELLEEFELFQGLKKSVLNLGST